jgi:ferritin
MKISEKMQEAINNQINVEFMSSYTYLAMSAWCERMSFLGSAAWMRQQSQEEKIHAMKLYEFLADRGATIVLKPIPAPAVDFGSLTKMFQQALKNEEEVSESINSLYEVALEEKAYATAAELQWFLTEQVEEEKTARTIVRKLELIKDDGPALLDLDRELGARQGVPVE